MFSRCRMVWYSVSAWLQFSLVKVDIRLDRIRYNPNRFRPPEIQFKSFLPRFAGPSVSRTKSLRPRCPPSRGRTVRTILYWCHLSWCRMLRYCTTIDHIQYRLRVCFLLVYSTVLLSGHLRYCSSVWSCTVLHYYLVSRTVRFVFEFPFMYGTVLVYVFTLLYGSVLL